MMLHFKTYTGKRLNICTDPETYNFNETEYTPILINDDGYDRLLRILDFNMVAYSEDLLNPPPIPDPEPEPEPEDLPWH